MLREHSPDILVLTHRLPYPPDKGERIRAYHMLKFLARRAAVHLVCPADEAVHADSLSALRSICRRVAAVPLGRFARYSRAAMSLLGGRTATEGAFYSPHLRRLIDEWSRGTSFHAVLACSSSMVQYLQSPGLRGVPTVVDLIDADSQKWLDYAAATRGPLKWVYAIEGRRLRRIEQQLPAQVDAVALVSDAEVALLREFCLDGQVVSIPCGVDLDHFSASETSQQPECVFVGALDYRPNVDGVVWFSQEIWPAVRAACPGATFTLVGRRPGAAVRRLASHPGVTVVGQVPDVRPYLDRAALAVAPLRMARGVQSKVLEALAMNKAVVASPQAINGIAVRPGKHLLVAASPKEWTESVCRVLADHELRHRLGLAGRRFIETNHRWEHCLKPLVGLLRLPTSFRIAGAPAPAPSPPTIPYQWTTWNAAV